MFVVYKSHCRRIHVQNEMFNVREMYEDIFKEIEGEQSELEVVWPKDILCYPQFVSKKQAKKLQEQKVDDKTFICPKKVETISKGEIMKFIPNEASLEEEANSKILPAKSIEFKSTDPHNELNVEQMNFLEIENLKKLPKNELVNVRENVSLEMLWINQAIQSRVQVSFILHTALIRIK